MANKQWLVSEKTEIVVFFVWVCVGVRDAFIVYAINGEYK